jgi:hypothetical protein
MNGAQLVDRTPGLTYRQVAHWVSKGWLKPQRRWKATGGVPLEFDPEEVMVARMMARLVAAGVGPEAAHRVARGGDLAPGITVHIGVPA